MPVLDRDHQDVIDQEMRLLTAFRQRDVRLLGELLHEEASVILPNGRMLYKQAVLEDYLMGTTTMDAMSGNDQVVRVFGDVATVTVVLNLQGTFENQLVGGRFRYTRVWLRESGSWKVLLITGVPIT